MTIERIYYQRNFRIGEFLYENIGIGIAINEGEDAKQALDQAKDLVEKYHWENVNKDLEHQQQEPLRDIQVVKSTPEEQRTADLIADILMCPTLAELESYKLLLNRPELEMAYNQRLKHFQP